MSDADDSAAKDAEGWKKLEETHPGAVQLERRRVMCPMHGEPFRAGWPKGGLVFMIEAFRAATELPGIWDEARRLMPAAEIEAFEASGESKIPARALERALDRKPACCRFSSGKLVALYITSNVGVMARCKACKRKGLGTPYVTTGETYAHLCFVCVSRASTTDPRVA